MANKYWVGGGTNTNWNSSPTTNWANSDGGPGNQTVPAAGDAVFFTANSGTGNVVLNTSPGNLAGFDCTGSRNQFSGAASYTITAGNLRLPDGVGATWAPTGTLTLGATSGTQQIKCNGNHFVALTLNGAGGTFQLQDALNVDNNAGAGALTLSAGTLDGQTFAVNIGVFSCTGTTARAVQGSGLWTILNTSTAGTIVMSIGTGTNLTVSSWTSNFVFTLNGTNTKTVAFGAYTIQGTVTINLQTGGSLALGTTGIATTFSSLVTINGAAGLSASFLGNSCAFNGGLTIVGPLSVTWTAAWTIAGFNVSGGPISFSHAVASTQTLSGTVSVVGTAAGPIGFQGGTYNSTQAPVSMASGTPTFTWCSFRDMAFSGGATFAATNSFDLGNNSGITITGPQLGIQPSYSVGI